MEQSELEKKFKSKGFCTKYGQTIENTFAIVGIKEGNPNLSSDINRNNSGWPKAKYIIVRDRVLSDKEYDELKGKWKKVNGKGDFNTQYLVYQTNDGWKIMDNFGTYIGDEKFIERMLLTDACNSRQIIYFGSPGTGKSHEVKRITGEAEGANMPNVFRTTFHPDTDYATFVGCYKPTMKGNEISYEFVSQTFTDAYIYAYKNQGTPTYLVIEEINRGNCAQIFGDLFQLLDRKEDGRSEYSIKADKDLAKYLEKALAGIPEEIANGKLCLPENLYILATMNTSDQSLFPMDSAFKRRWDWKYVPICYDEEVSSKFEIDIEGEKFKWIDFIKAVNGKIFDLTQSEDKELGNFFIRSSVDAGQFKSKVMFYLWNEVLKDEVGNSKYFFYAKEEGENKKDFTFKDLYSKEANNILKGFMRYLGIGGE